MLKRLASMLQMLLFYIVVGHKETFHFVMPGCNSCAHIAWEEHVSGSPPGPWTNQLVVLSPLPFLFAGVEVRPLMARPETVVFLHCCRG